MTKLLEEAFAAASKLPQAEQNTFARWVLDELAAEKRWEATFADSEDILGELADGALEEHKKGKTKPLGADTL